MTADLLTRNAPVWESHPWFLEVYAKLLDNPGSAEGSIAVRLQMAADPVEAGLALFLAGTHDLARFLVVERVLTSPLPCREVSENGARQ